MTKEDVAVRAVVLGDAVVGDVEVDFEIETGDGNGDFDDDFVESILVVVCAVIDSVD